MVIIAECYLVRNTKIVITSKNILKTIICYANLGKFLFTLILKNTKTDSTELLRFSFVHGLKGNFNLLTLNYIQLKVIITTTSYKKVLIVVFNKSLRDRSI